MRFDDPSLLAAICQQPGDDDLRLVYADWLDDHDEPDRAEFVRLQCARPVELSPSWSLSSGPVVWSPYTAYPTDKVEPSISRQMTLYRKSVRKWNGVIHRRLQGGPLQQKIDSRRGLVRGWSYRRGFPCTVWATVQTIALFPEDVFSIGPLERLNLYGPLGSVNLVKLLDSLEPYPLRVLDFTRVPLGAPERRVITAARQLILHPLEQLILD